MAETVCMTEEQKNKCHQIIHTASGAAAAAAAGIAQLPCADSAIIAPIQIGMICGLGNVFDMEISKSSAKGLAASAVGTTVGRAISQVLLGWIPGLGNALNAATAAGITEAMGWAVANQLAQKAQRMLPEG